MLGGGCRVVWREEGSMMFIFGIDCFWRLDGQLGMYDIIYIAVEATGSCLACKV